MSDYAEAQDALEKIGVSLTNARPIPPNWKTLENLGIILKPVWNYSDLELFLELIRI